MDPSFDEANYGCSAFRAFLGRMPHRVRDIGKSGENLRIQLIESDDAGQTRSDGGTAAPLPAPTVSSAVQE